MTTVHLLGGVFSEATIRLDDLVDFDEGKCETQGGHKLSPVLQGSSWETTHDLTVAGVNELLKLQEL